MGMHAPTNASVFMATPLVDPTRENLPTAGSPRTGKPGGRKQQSPTRHRGDACHPLSVPQKPLDLLFSLQRTAVSLRFHMECVQQLCTQPTVTSNHWPMFLSTPCATNAQLVLPTSNGALPLDGPASVVLDWFSPFGFYPKHSRNKTTFQRRKVLLIKHEVSSNSL